MLRCWATLRQARPARGQASAALLCQASAEDHHLLRLAGAASARVHGQARAHAFSGVARLRALTSANRNPNTPIGPALGKAARLIGNVKFKGMQEEEGKEK